MADNVVDVTEPCDLNDNKDAGKRKRLFKFKNFKQFFKRKKNSKSKDGEVKSVSVANVSTDDKHDTDDDLDSHFPGTNGALSLSHDSVFSPEKPRGSNIGDMTKSMERLPQDNNKGGNFQSELASKLQKRAGHFKTSQSSVKHALTERGDRSFESDHSVGSMGDSSENELEEDFFKEKWSSSSSLTKRSASPAPGAHSDLDLNIISSTASLNVSAAKHKIAIKQKGKRASALVTNRRRANSPRPGAATSMQTLPEEISDKSRASDQTDDPVTSTASLDSIASSGTKSPILQLEEPVPDYDLPLQEQVKPSPRLSTKKPQVKDTKPQLQKTPSKDTLENKDGNSGEASTKIKIPRPRTLSGNESSDKDGSLEFTKIVLKKTSSSDKAEVSAVVSPVESKAEGDEGQGKSGESAASVVVMRQKSGSQDVSKRQTIAVADVCEKTTPFGERKLNKRSSWIESNKNWQDLDKKEPKKQEVDVDEGSNKNEFAQMFNKFQRRVSQKKETSPVKMAVAADAKTDDTSVSTEFGATKTTTSLKSVPSISSSTQPQVSSSSKSVTLTTSSETTSSAANKVTASTITRPSSFIDKSKSSSVQQRQPSFQQSKPQPKTLSIDKAKSPGSPRRQGSVAVTKSTLTSSPKQRSLSTSSSVMTTMEKKREDALEKKTAVIESKPSSGDAVKTKTTPVSPTAASKDSNKTVFIMEKTATNTNKAEKTNADVKGENDENTQPKSDLKGSSSVIYRRPSPVQKDRARSSTLPEQPVLRQKTGIENNNSSVVSEKITPSPTASPQRSKSMKPIGSKPQEASDGKPSWIAMAKQKTGGWNSAEDSSKQDPEGKDVKSESHTQEAKETGNESKASIKDLMRKFQS